MEDLNEDLVVDEIVLLVVDEMEDLNEELLVDGTVLLVVEEVVVLLDIWGLEVFEELEEAKRLLVSASFRFWYKEMEKYIQVGMLVWLDEEVLVVRELELFEELVDVVLDDVVVLLERELEDFEDKVELVVLEIVVLWVIFEKLEDVVKLLDLLLEVETLEVELLLAAEDVEVQAPTIEGTALAPEPMATTLVPQLAA